MRYSDINLNMSRYTHTLAGQEAIAVAGLPDLSLPSSEKQIATGIDDKSVRSAETGPRNLTPQLTPTAYSGCNKTAVFGNGKRKLSETMAEHKYLTNGDIRTEKASMSPNDIENGEAGIRTPGTGVYPYDGLANRCLKPLGHLSERSFSNLPYAGKCCKKITLKPHFFISAG
jgi:hypothetical protein